MNREEIIERLQHELKAADAAQEMYTTENMSEDDKMQFQFYEGRMTLLQELLVDVTAKTMGV
tara:strand:+ start:56571 stop:56756 length:186 start_codon:yes stop_codon:yes gene_type:complete